MNLAEGEVKHWRDAYQGAVKGETKPDRIMNPEEENTLCERLLDFTKRRPRDEYFGTVLIEAGCTCDSEAVKLASQLNTAFSKAHWSPQFDPNLSNYQKDQLSKVISFASEEGIIVLTDERDIGQLLYAAFLDTHLQQGRHADEPGPIAPFKIGKIGQKNITTPIIVGPK